MYLHYSMLFMLTPTTNPSRKELGESVIFQPFLQAYPTHHSWIVAAHISLGNLECHWKAFNRQLVRTWQLLHYLDQQPSAQTQLLSTLQVELLNIEDIYNSGETTIISAIKLLQSNQSQAHICHRRILLPLIATQLSQEETLVHIISTLNVTRYPTQVNRHSTKF